MIIRQRLFTTLALAFVSMAWLPDTGAAMSWKPAPAKHHGHDRMAPQQFTLSDGAKADIRLILPDLSEQALSMEKDGLVSIKQTRLSYFHALIAEHTEGTRHDTAIRYLHFSGKPAKSSPSKLLALPHTALDIVPEPLPREHWSYLANANHTFIVRFQNRPLAGKQITLSTSNGSTQTYITDQDGYVRLSLPDDFADVQPGHRNNRPAEFMLHCAYIHDGESYITTLTAPYMTDPAHWQSLTLGIAVMSGGIVLGGMVSWRMRRKQAVPTSKSRSA